ncbi:hypothetical protein ACFL2H_00995 [Planctomycetota bacterium]
MNSQTQSITSKNGRSRVNFAWSGDRFSHTIDRRNEEGAWETILRSVEGTPDDSWPPSPPFQEVESHVVGNGLTCLLAVGRAGSSHWSASVEEIQDDLRSEDETRFRFDVACRLKSSESILGSTYELNQSLSQENSSDTIYKDTQGKRIELTSDAIVTDNAKSLAVRPQSTHDTKPATARWVYDFLITS